MVQRLMPTASGPWAVPLAMPRALATMPWICDASAAVRSFASLVFFLKLTYLGPTCQRSKMIPFLFIWVHMSESGDELGPIFAVHES